MQQCFEYTNIILSKRSRSCLKPDLSLKLKLLSTLLNNAVHIDTMIACGAITLESKVKVTSTPTLSLAPYTNSSSLFNGSKMVTYAA